MLYDAIKNKRRILFLLAYLNFMLFALAAFFDLQWPYPVMVAVTIAMAILYMIQLIRKSA